MISIAPTNGDAPARQVAAEKVYKALFNKIEMYTIEEARL
jgi:hypothetical protein